MMKFIAAIIFVLLATTVVSAQQLTPRQVAMGELRAVEKQSAYIAKLVEQAQRLNPELIGEIGAARDDNERNREDVDNWRQQSKGFMDTLNTFFPAAAIITGLIGSIYYGGRKHGAHIEKRKGARGGSAGAANGFREIAANIAEASEQPNARASDPG